MSKTLKKTLSIILAILMIVTTIPFAFAADETTVITEFFVEYYEDAYPGGWSNNIEVNPHIGIQDEGKVALENGDELTVVCDTWDIDTWDIINTQTAILHYEDGQFNGNISFDYDENSYIETYGCIGKGGGTDEYINIHCEIIDNVLYIVFPDSYVHYSRLRMVGEANTSYDVTVDGFFTAENYDEPVAQDYTLTTDSNGNAYLYGIFNEGAILSVNGVACTLDYRNGTEAGKSYAVCAVHNFSDGCCIECYVKCAHANCSNSVCNDCGYICIHSDTLVQKDAKAPTCTEIGWEAYEYCTACDYTTYEEIPVSTHVDANCDYKCDYNCGYVYETPDFSDAKVLSTDADGYLYIDGQKIDVYLNYFDEERQLIPSGKYKLEGDIETINCTPGIKSQENVIINLDGYKWTFEGLEHLLLEGELSIYDLSEKETGKLVASSSWGVVSIQDKGAVFNLYSGTLESINTYALRCTSGTVNLYGGKIKGSKYAISYMSSNTKGLNIDDTVIESGDDYADIFISLGVNDIAGAVDVTDYKGDSLTASVSLYDTVGKITVFKGIKNAQDAEKYQITDVVCDDYYDLFWEKTEYDEATGEKSIYIVNKSFIQQPTVDNNYTVDFNYPATFQWYEVEEKNLGTYIVEEFSPLFSYDFKADDILVISTDSEFRHVVIETGIIDTDYEYIDLDEYEKTATITFDADTTVDLFVAIVNADNPVEVNFTVFKATKLDGETEKTLQNAECGKSYCCKATVGEKVYVSDSVDVGHSIVYVDAQAPTCTEIGWEAYECCTKCDYTTYVEIPSNGHTPLEAVTENEVAPKCGVAGSYDLVVYCDDCGAELDRDTKTVDALTHTDADGDYKCDNGCGHEFEKPAPEEPTPDTPDEPNTPDEPDTPDEPTDSTCDHLCHKSGILGFFWKIVKFFSKLFKINPVCECGAAHY